MFGKERYLFALLGAILVALELFAAKPEGVRSIPDTAALYLGFACFFVQFVIWLAALVSRIKARRSRISL
jgi:hypothetical protein